MNNQSNTIVREEIYRDRGGSRTPLSGRESAVSPVVGIMLMLTITLILAAIISGMTGGIAQSQKKPPQMVFEASVVNDGTITKTSFFDIQVISVSEGIQTRDLKIQTEWRDPNGNPQRTTISGGQDKIYPLGYGPGVTSSPNFGDYTILAGTRLHANGSDVIFPRGMNVTLTDQWITITESTPIRIQFVHVPSGSIIADKEIMAEEDR